MSLVIEGGRVIDPANGIDQQTNVYVSDGKVLAVADSAPESFSASETIDATGKVVCPGFIDLCAHLREPGYTQKGTIKSETAAAVAGGITTLVTPPTTNPIVDTPSVAEFILDRAEAAANARVLPMGALTKQLKGEHLAPMHALSQSGCVAFTNVRETVGNSLTLMRALEYAATHDLLVQFQAQNNDLVGNGCMHDDTTCTRLGLNGISEAAETVEVARCLLLVEQTGVRAHFGQLTCERSVKMVAGSRERGLPVTCDVAVHHLLLTDENVNGFDANFHLVPPLRSQLDRAGLLQSLLKGDIQVICSDHQPHEAAAKQAPFPATEPGMSGLETLLPLCLLLVEQDFQDLPQVIEKLTSAPADILRREDLGRLSEGARADICIFDPEQQWTLSEETIQSAGHNTPFKDYPLKGRVIETLLDGERIYTLAEEA